jgi:uncharacterized protein (DUF305 family)
MACTSANDTRSDATGAASTLVTPADDSAEAGFARDMATHHAQAVDMAFLLRDRTSDPRLRMLADDIIVTQSAQRGMFMGWLQLWGLPQAPAGPRMAWMTDAHAAPAAGAPDGTATMMGMASTTELEALRDATGRDAEVLFLQLMIRHHEGGVLMARAALDRSTHDAVTTMAGAIDRAQRGEIETMTAMLTERGAVPLPSLLAEGAHQH